MRLGKTTLILAAGAALALPFLGGCKTDKPGVRNYAGYVVGYVPAPPAQVTDAARETLEDLDLQMIFAESTKVDGKVTAMTAREKKVDIDVSETDDGLSKVCVRIGEFGDEDLSVEILDRIEQKTAGQE
jgi:hypothetical protein